MKFNVEETVTVQDYVEFNACYILQANNIAGKTFRGASALLTGLQRLGGGALIILGAIVLIGGLIAGLFNAFGVICLMCGTYLIRKSMEPPRNRAVKPYLDRLTGEEQNTYMRFFFDEDGFDVFELSGNSSYRYFILTDVWEDENRFYLLEEGKLKFILQKQAFVEGTPDDFSVWIAGKIGKDIKKITE